MIKHIDTAIAAQIQKTSRLTSIKDAVITSPYSICIERAMLVTEYFKKKRNREKNILIQKAEALTHVLANKTCRIYPDELIVGSTTSKRVAGPLFPELHGLPVLEDLLIFSKRKVNPLQISRSEKIKLVREVFPFWVNKFLAYKAFSGKELWSFMFDQLNPKYYLINETGGIGHLIPDYEMLINYGLEDLIKKADAKKCQLKPGDEKIFFYEAIAIVCKGVIKMAENYRKKLIQLARTETDPLRKNELDQLAEIVLRVPAHPARTLHEALQSIWLVHTAVFLEGLDNGISFGRMDQYLFPFYQRDIETGIISREKAKEILGCFAIKTSEIIPVFSKKITQSHGGFLSGQALTIGGFNRQGSDASNELSIIFLELMDELRMRQPNFHARIHRNSPKHYLDKVMTNLAKGVNSPAVYNDELIVQSLKKCGFREEDAMDYSTLGCVEINAAGKTFGSTDAALVNLPVCLELALNEGRRFGALTRDGCKTPPPESFSGISDLKTAFEQQLRFLINRLIKTLAPIELANRDLHPTLLSSALIQGCMEKGMDLTAGGAMYNFSGVQGVGITDTADSIYAIETLVFNSKKYSMKELVNALKTNFRGKEKMQAAMKYVPKFGNDHAPADLMSKWVADSFYDCFEGKVNTRGGKFVAGFYSTTTHYSFGLHTGASANGRKKGDPFTSGIAPTNGMDKKGPTALLNSVTTIDFVRAHNGINVNAKFDTATLKGEHGKEILKALLLTYFKKGGMQIQLNVLDTGMLKEARDNPAKYPWLIVRVSGYSAYFNDLSPAMKDEIIQRSCLADYS